MSRSRVRRSHGHRLPFLRWLLLAPPGQAVFLASATALLFLVYQEQLFDAARALWDHMLVATGATWGYVALWTVVVVAALHWQAQRVGRFWYRWLGALLFAVPLAMLLAQFAARLGPPEADTLGGDLGERLAGPGWWTAFPGIVGTALVAAWVAAPRRGTRIARWVLRWAARVTYRGLLSLARAYRRVRPDKRIARAVVLWCLALAATAQGLVSILWMWRRRPREPIRRVIIGSLLTAPLKRAVGKRPVVSHERGGEQPLASIQPISEGAPAQAAIVSAKGWELPRLDLLHNVAEVTVSKAVNQQQAQLIERALSEYGIEVEVAQIRPGPTVTMFGLVPGWVRRQRNVREVPGRINGRERGGSAVRQVEERVRVKVDAILAREKDLALALAAPSIRIEAPVPGESVVGIEVPNPTPSLVTLRGVMESAEFQKASSRSPLALGLGRAAGGEAVVASLAAMPHLLIAGSTGSGKSVCLSSIIACLLFQAAPTQLRMLLVDPKRVELTPFSGIPHLLAPVVVDPEEVVRYLRGMMREMDRRYRVMQEAGVRNIEGFNANVLSAQRMPYLLLIVDELADLMMVAPHDVEHSLCRLAQLGRATGIHLLISTQRPSVDVVTGLIKANFPCRISFNVTSQVDSRTILDGVGAEKLLGRGDMLFLPPEAAKPRRIQGTYVSDQEIARLVRFWKGQHGPPLAEISLEASSPGQEADGDGDGQDLDELFQKAVQMAVTHRHLSTSLLQRRLRIGYPRAARLREQLEDEGIIAADGEVISNG